jgi:glycosyltransferase involved in cell wall biosynthesis
VARIRLNRSTEDDRPCVLIVGPGPAQIGGVATFIKILLSSPVLRKKYELLHLDTTRGPLGAGLASRFALINIVYLVRQVYNFLLIVIRNRPQIIHVPITSYWAFWKDTVFILLGRTFGLKVVAHLHGGLFERYYRESAPIVRGLIRWALYRPHVIVALSNHWKRFLLGVGSELRVEIVPNTIEPSFVPVIDQESYKTVGAITVLFVGQLGQHKGVFDILKSVPLVAEHRPDIRFVFAGASENQHEGAEIEKASKSLNGAVQFLGQVTGQAKLDLFLKSNLFILPSYAENLPYSLLEAMAAGLPVISTPVGAIPEVIEDGRNGFLIPPGDYQALAEKILLILGNAELQSAMSRANRGKIRKEYLPELAASHFDCIYRKLLEAAESLDYEENNQDMDRRY